uniref:Uncharacterized protein n=1 Tax=Anguilla anguilla TaxID=7936 RepID=A0A0E9R896_ANGAN
MTFVLLRLVKVLFTILLQYRVVQLPILGCTYKCLLRGKLIITAPFV